MNFGRRLKELRRIKNLSQQELAQETGYSQQTISAYECNMVSPNLEALNIFAKALGVDIAELLDTA